MNSIIEISYVATISTTEYFKGNYLPEWYIVLKEIRSSSTELFDNSLLCVI